MEATIITINLLPVEKVAYCCKGRGIGGDSIDEMQIKIKSFRWDVLKMINSGLLVQ